jgi:hypothetical protein
MVGRSLTPRRGRREALASSVHCEGSSMTLKHAASGFAWLVLIALIVLLGLVD